MSRASRLLTLMADGRQYSNADLCRATGLSKRQIDSAISQLRDAGRLATAPVLHTITPEGLDALGAGRYHAVRKDRKATAPAIPSQTVEHAIASRPPLQAVWGGAHA